MEYFVLQIVHKASSGYNVIHKDTCVQQSRLSILGECLWSMVEGQVQMYTKKIGEIFYTGFHTCRIDDHKVPLLMCGDISVHQNAFSSIENTPGLPIIQNRWG